MKSTAVWALIMLNAALLVSFVWRILPENQTMAQRAVAPSRAGDYLLIPTEVNGVSTGILVVLDQTNAQLSAVTFDESNNTVEMMSKVDLRSIFQPAGAPPARNPARRGGN